MNEMRVWTFAELEQQAVERKLKRAVEREQQVLEREKEELASREQMRGKMVEFLVRVGLDREEVERALVTESLDEPGWAFGALHVEDHEAITFGLECDENGELAWRRGKPIWSVDGFEYEKLGQALLVAREQWEHQEEERERLEAMERAEAAWREEHAAERQQEAEAENARRAIVQGMMERHPILFPLLQVLEVYLEEREEMEEALDFAHGQLERGDEATTRMYNDLQREVSEKDGRIQELERQLWSQERKRR